MANAPWSMLDCPAPLVLLVSKWKSNQSHKQPSTNVTVSKSSQFYRNFQTGPTKETAKST